MPAQLIFASVPSGLAPGRSGYCTVARSKSLGDRLVAEIERHSAHEPGMGDAHVFRLLHAGGETVAVITRFTDSGPDYTGRAATLAHHLVFSSRETQTLPPPAEIAARFSGWKNRWDGPPAWIDESPLSLSGNPSSLPANEWKRVTGDAGHAASLIDDAGQAKSGTVPRSDSETTLRLFAESALLTQDRGWTSTFSTRPASQDRGSLWRIGTTPTAPSSPSGRYAVMARSGALPGMMPKLTREKVSSKAFTPLTNEQSPLRKKIPAAYVIAAAAVAAIPAIIFLTLRSEKPSTPDSVAPITKPTITPDPVPPEVKIAIDLADANDWISFYETSKTLSPAVKKLGPVAERLSKLRRKLIPETLARITAELDEAKELPSPSARIVIKNRIKSMNTVATETNTPRTEADTRHLLAIEDMLALMDQLDTLPSNAAWIRPSWVVAEETPLAVTRTSVLEMPAPVSAFLTNAEPPISASCDAYEGPGGKKDTARSPIRLSTGAQDFVAGKILSTRHSEWGRILELRVETNERLRITLRAPNGSDKRITDPSAPIIITFTDSAKKASLTLILNPSSTQSPIIASTRVLRRTPAGIEMPTWLESALTAQTMSAGGMRTLLPHGFESTPRDYPRMPVPVTAVAQALRTRLDKSIRSGADATTLSRLHEQLREVAEHPLECGAPWSCILVPPGADAPIPLLRFIP